ncbi:alpha/beta fold hydrolase [Haloarcula sp. CBA1122]|uniref:alpha/beta fold hydrolase n=1 Tax=Haloarcula sp. CBA1122 TaxID=2668069 RepID=UPI001306320A|nr:alpha/beta hydrolase [Haloarcula sp. CBA1122]MUV50689.1 alpha/beta fold hydrolase [Haloarcula sp. CBA1122]
METLTSPDGTAIAYDRPGDGQPVVLVHGTTGTSAVWDRFRSQLPDGYTPVAVDRRGRGESGDADDHSLAREVDDVVALIDSLPGDPVLFGHSFGGLCALEAARETDIAQLILYEPAILVGDHRDGAPLAPRLRGHLDAGDREAVIEAFFRETSTSGDPSQWPTAERAPLAETVDAPTLLLAGSESPAYLRDGIRAIDDAMSAATFVELSDVGHVGVWRAPEKVGAAVRSFLPDR